ncbi:MAG: hypothetical protein DMG48_09260 [Acidobacteria bacterium]|nr:MAG: hypothetical protein DMG48_09260 [Acidobacteriota bacterium]
MCKLAGQRSEADFAHWIIYLDAAKGLAYMVAILLAFWWERACQGEITASRGVSGVWEMSWVV